MRYCYLICNFVTISINNPFIYAYPSKEVPKAEPVWDQLLLLISSSERSFKCISPGGPIVSLYHNIYCRYIIWYALKFNKIFYKVRDQMTYIKRYVYLKSGIQNVLRTLISQGREFILKLEIFVSFCLFWETQKRRFLNKV